jgi:chromosomal replication initiator protein
MSQLIAFPRPVFSPALSAGSSVAADAILASAPASLWYDAWNRVRDALRAQLGDATFRSWLAPLQLQHVSEDSITLAAPTRFVREWVISHYQDTLRDAWRTEWPDLAQLQVIVGTGAAPAAALAPQETTPSVAAPVAQAAPSIQVVGDHFDSISAALDPRYTFDNFVVGKPNELAHAAARRVADSAEVVPGCNPLFIYGGVGLGKTHLMHAIAWQIRQSTPHRRVIYLSAEKFMYQFIRSLRTKESFAFKELFRSVDVLMIDDVQFIAGKDSTQEEFFHTFNALVDQNKQLVISGDRSPSDLDGFEERVRSRLGWGLVADVHTTTYELRLGILQAKLEQMNASVPGKVLELLAHKITSNVRVLEGALNRLVAHATLVGTAVTMESAQQLLHDLLLAHDRRLTIDEIQKQVAAHYSIKLSDMHSARRSRIVARPRQVAMYLAKQLTTKSLPEIGRKFGGKDHTTVMHAVKRIDELMQSDSELTDDVALLTRLLQG